MGAVCELMLIDDFQSVSISTTPTSPSLLHHPYFTHTDNDTNDQVLVPGGQSEEMMGFEIRIEGSSLG